MGYDCGGWVGIWHSQIPASLSCKLRYRCFHFYIYFYIFINFQIPASPSCKLSNHPFLPFLLHMFPFFHHFLDLFLYFHLLIDPCISLLQVEQSSFSVFPYFIKFFPTFSVPSTVLSIFLTFSIHRIQPSYSEISASLFYKSSDY